MTFAVKNKMFLVCIKPKESSVQLPAKSKCQCDMMTSCIRKTNCRKTCFYCQQNHHYIFCKLPPAVTCSESIRKQFLKEVARKEKVNKQNTEKKPENFTFSINFTLSDGKFSMVPKCFIPESWSKSSEAKLSKGFMIKITWTQSTTISKFKSCQLSQVPLLCSVAHVKTQTVKTQTVH